MREEEEKQKKERQTSFSFLYSSHFSPVIMLFNHFQGFSPYKQAKQETLEKRTHTYTPQVNLIWIITGTNQ